MKNNQKCVRLSDRCLKYIENYRGDNFSNKLENLILDYEEKHDAMVLDWEHLQAHINDKHAELVRIQQRCRQLLEVETRLKPLADALKALLTDAPGAGYDCAKSKDRKDFCAGPEGQQESEQSN